MGVCGGCVFVLLTIRGFSAVHEFGCCRGSSCNSTSAGGLILAFNKVPAEM